MPQFNRQFGEQLSDGTYQVPAPWQAGLSNGAVVGEIIGLTINGYVSERFGYRYTVIACLAMIAGFIAIFFTATTVEQLQVGEILCGIVSYIPSLICLSISDGCLAMGRVPNADHYLCFRGLPCRTSRLSHNLGEFLLGSRSSNWHWRCQS